MNSDILGLWVFVQFALVLWTVRHSTFLGRVREEPHICHVLNWFSLFGLWIALTTIGIQKSGSNGPAILLIFCLFWFWSGVKSLRALIKRESDWE